MGSSHQPLPRNPQIPLAVTSTHLLEGFPELATRGHAELLSDVSRHFQQQHLHESRHEPILQKEEPCQLYCTELARQYEDSMRTSGCPRVRLLPVARGRAYWYMRV